MSVQDKSSKDQVMDIKGEDKKTDAPELKSTSIIDGNIPSLTVLTLDAINKNIIVLVQQMNEALKLLKGIQDGGQK